MAYLLFCLVLGIGLAIAQTTSVIGIVISGDDGEPIIGASVVVKGTTTGTVTDYDGAFSLNVPSSAQTLVVSYVGMEPQEVAVAPVIRVVLSASSQALDEVVVTAMGISREKKSLGYALQEVKSDELTQAGQMSVANSLSGKIAGVQITSQGSQVGASQNIVIRGNSSFNNNQPLIVVDGVPVINDNKNFNEAAAVNIGSGLNDINPNDIESISVLKGGSAALYGMRAGNGVILITTKSGRRDRGVTVSYDGDFTVDQIYNIPKYQNKYGQGYNGSEYEWKHSSDSYLTYQEYAVKHGYSYYNGKGGGVNDEEDVSWGPRLDIGLMIPQYNSPVVNGERQATPWVSHPNNVKDFFRLGYSTNHSVSFTSTSEHSSTRASLSYRGQEGTTPNTDQKRYAASISTRMSLNQYIDFDLSANYTHTVSDNLPGQGYNSRNVMQTIGQWFGRQVDMKDLKANWDQKDEFGEYTHYNWQSEYATNPYWVVYKNLNRYTRDRMFGKSSLWYKPTEWLKFEGRLGLDHYASDQNSTVAWATDYPDGYFRNYVRNETEFNADFIAYYNQNFGDFSVNVLAGANYRDERYYQKTLGANDLVVPELYTVANALGNPYVAEAHRARRSNSVYANASLDWKNQLYADISVRNDWDSTIEDSFFYPSFSGSWILTETFESLGDTDWLNFLKIRGGWAKIGSATDPYEAGFYYSIETNSFDGTALYYNPETYPPVDLRPEMVKTWEIGLEANLFYNRLHIDGAYYQRTTTDQIMEANVAASSGYNKMLLNAGKVKNKGVELQISGDIIKNPKGFNWTATLNWSKDKSKIIELYKDPVTGQELEAYTINSNWSVYNYAMPGKAWGTLVGTGFVYNEDGSILTEGGMPVYESSQEIGDVTPKWLAGFKNEFSYKEWTLGFLLDYRRGGDIFSVTQMFGAYTGVFDFTAAGDIRENGVIVGQNYMTDKVFKTADGQINNEVVSAQEFFENYYAIAEMSIIDGSFLKLREAYVTYTFPRSLLAKTKYISAARVSLIGTNLALLWTHKSNLTNLDPETTMYADNKGVGLESNSYPPTRSFGLKLHLTF
ncbi:MAG: SusC/RagA family TonB-linked outer membrane protein [Tannerellaceae bacterium]|nr:SusC/RagA family TonB-linked outer membrane protein [Tannerellaceae bacterium]